MQNSLGNLPLPDELEVSLFGPGYGESLAVHIGAGQWIVVDCCLDPNTGKPAPLQYLQSLDVDVGRTIRLVVATHWHDDHVRGLSSLLRECDNAKLAISGALDTDEFLKLIALYWRRVTVKSSGLDEFVEMFRILEERKPRGTLLNPPTFALSERLLYRDEIPLAKGTVEATVFSLSPSDASVLRAQLAFADLLPTEGERKRRILSPTPNNASVVLWIRVGDHALLLGADLENTSDPKTGWSVILDESTVVSGEAGVFKVAHHGAESAHEPRLWNELLSKDPFAILSPFNRGNRLLPSAVDVRRIIGLTSNAYLTSRPMRKRYRWTNKVVRELVQGATQDIHSIDVGWGQIRLRRGIANKREPWQVELFGDALALQDYSPAT